MTDGLPPHLQAWVEAETASTVEAAETIGRGASRRIWAVALAGGREVVVRADTGDGPVAGTPLTLGREAAVYGALAPTDLPIPVLHAAHPDGTALLLDRAPGADQLKAVPADERWAVAEDLGRCLGRLHLLDPGALELGRLAVPDGTDPTVHDLELWRSIARTRCGDASTPVAEVVLSRLASSVPASTTAALCHGDAGPGNFLHAGGRVTALLDWEFAHLGDPHDDLAWVAVRNQVLRHPLAAAATFATWRATTGHHVDLPRLEWFRALVLARMLVSCDATIAWAGPEAPSARVQAVLRPFLAVAVFEALRRVGQTDPDLQELERGARAAWEGAPVAGLLDDPTRLDDLGALL